MPVPSYSQAFAWTDSKGRSWQVKLDWSEVGGRIECVGFRVADPLETTPVTTSLLRELNVASIVNEKRRERLRSLRKLANQKVSPDVVRRAEHQLPAYEQGYQRLPPDHLQKVAAAYQAAWERGDNPTRAVAEELHGSRSAAAKWVARAREKGLLGQTEQRRPGGIEPAPTPPTKKTTTKRRTT